jgi:peroxiredoxin
MKFLLVILTFFLTACNQAQPILTYEEGRANCDRIREDKQKAVPGSFVYVSPDCMVGAQIPEFESRTLDDLLMNRQKLEGKITILNFWFIACPPCVAEIPGFNALVEKYGTDRINYVAMGRDDAEDITAFLKGNPWKFEILPDNHNTIHELFKINWGFPTTFLLNEKAEIILAFSGGKSDETAVQEIQDMLVPAIEQALKE